MGDTAAVPESARVEIADVGGVAQNLSVAAVRLDGDRVVASIRNAVRTRATRACAWRSTAGRPATSA